LIFLSCIHPNDESVGLSAPEFVKVEMIGKNTSMLHNGRLPTGKKSHDDTFFNSLGSYERGKKEVNKILKNRDAYKNSFSDKLYNDSDFGLELNPDVLNNLTNK